MDVAAAALHQPLSGARAPGSLRAGDVKPSRRKPSDAPAAAKAAVAVPAEKAAAQGASEGRELAIRTLQAICEDLRAPAGARAQAARTLLEAAGALSAKGGGDGSAAAEMSAAEIDEALMRAQAREGA